MTTATRSLSLCLAVYSSLTGLSLAAPSAPPNGSDQPLPRNLTPAEAELIRRNPIQVDERGATPPPMGAVSCVPEYAPMDAIVLTFQGSASWQAILRSMAQRITTTGNANVYAVVSSAAQQASINTYLLQGGVDVGRVAYVITPTNSIWVRDYGPRYIYEGGVRAIVDHTYNRPRPQDDLVPFAIGAAKGQNVYEIPLIHGGGNFHLSGAVGPGGIPDAYSTELIVFENPSVPPAEIQNRWRNFQNLDVTITAAFPQTLDATRHIDMWMQICDDRKVVISDWPNNPGSIQDQICDTQAAAMEAAGYTVFRVPARSVNGVHYTYTNVVICNNIVLVPSYTNASVVAHNAQALATWTAAMPNHTIYQINCEAIVSAAGVMHCIVMHVPAYLGGGTSPIAYLKSLRGGEVLTPATTANVQWIADDDIRAINDTDVEVSYDAGNTWTLIAADKPANGSFAWSVPDRASKRVKFRVTVKDEQTNSGSDASEAMLEIAGSCYADFNGDGIVNSADVGEMINAWFEDQVDAGTRADWDNSGASTSVDVGEYINDWFASPESCGT